MATFPAIKPNTRALNLGDTPQLTYTGTSGATIRFLQNTQRVTQTLTLSYNSITETEVTQIYDHYNGQEGTLISFPLPSAIWAGYTTVPISVIDYEWRYAGTLAIEAGTPGRFNLTVNLVSSII